MKRTKEKNSISLLQGMRLGRHMLAIGWRIRPWAMVGYFVGALVETGGMLVALYASAKLAALLAQFAAQGTAPHIWFWLWADVASGTVSALGFLLMSYTKRTLYYRFVRWSVNTFMSMLCRIDLGSFYDNTTRNQLNKVSGSYFWQLSTLAEACLDLLYGLIRFGAVTAVVAQIAWWVTPVIALFLIPSLLGESRMAKMQWFVWDEKGDSRHIFWWLQDIVLKAKGQMELRSTQAAKFVLHKVDSMNNTFYHEQEGKYRAASRVLIPTRILESGGIAVGSVALLRQFLQHSISLDRYFFLSGALLRIGGALNNIFGTLTRMQESLLFADSYFDLITTEPEIVDRPEAVRLDTAHTPTITFRNMSFSYPGQSKPVFKNFNLEITAGQHVALVGENGVGKSTLIKLLLRFYRPTSGQILVNGVDLQDIAIESWYSQLATLFQDFNHYPLSIADNIAIGRSSEATDEAALKRASKFGGVDQLVKDYPHGWDTVLDSSFEKGVEPSGGQWQRVALARAFYRNAQMIILDEPTSAIDAKAEYDIFNNIFDHYKDKTALIVSHRFSTVRRADRILVFEKGSLHEEGTHQELMHKRGLYHEMFTKQAEGYR